MGQRTVEVPRALVGGLVLFLGGAAAAFVSAPASRHGLRAHAMQSPHHGPHHALSAIDAFATDSVPLGAASQVAGAATAVLAGAALAAWAWQRAASRRCSLMVRPRQNLVAARDGSSWGSMGYAASSSLDTSGKLPFVRLTRGSDEAIVYLYGGTVTSYKTGGTEWLAVRPDAKMDGSKPISGGLPHCFPQFGPGEIQQHGFARNLNWKLLEEPSEGGVCVLELTDTEETRAMWPHAFRCEYRVELKEGELATTLKVENTSASDFNFTTALHSYYGVTNINTCTITGGFEGKSKLDKTQDPPKLTTSSTNAVTISKFTEEIYKEVLPGTVTLTDEYKGDLEIVSGGGWKDVVIWNPYGDEKMGASSFVCVESAALAAVQLAPKGVWEATMNLVPKPKK